jgi:hypothetical protein
MSTTARVITAHRLATVGADTAFPVRRFAQRTRQTTRRAVRDGRERLREQRDQQRERAREATAARARDVRGTQADRLAAHGARDSAEHRQRQPHAEAAIDRLRDRRERLATRIAEARRTGDAKSVARLRARDRSLAEAIEAHRRAPTERGDSDGVHAGRSVAERQSWLDHQAGLRRGVPPGPRADPSVYRDYPRLAALAGVGEREYRALDPPAQRRVRLDVDRALRARSSATEALRASASEDPRGPADRSRAPERSAARGGARPLSADDVRLPPMTPRERQFGRGGESGSRHPGLDDPFDE